ncbi:MAG: hypothetical protein K0S65_6150, partial [Labilithrix sp.]|nr:hypothetical protein [Labilithrix sp.]
ALVPFRKASYGPYIEARLQCALLAL